MTMDIEEHRQPWESDEHWVFRKEFLLAHEGKFTEDRLLCLAQVFANIELLGCNYPGQVMRQVNELAKDIPNLESIRKKRIDKATIKFVKATTDNSGNKRSGDNQSYPSQVKMPRSDNQSKNINQYHTKNRTGAASYFQGQGGQANSAYGRSNAGETLSPQISTISISSNSKMTNKLGSSGERGHTVYKSKDAVVVECDSMAQSPMMSFKQVLDETHTLDKTFVSSHDGSVRDMPIQSYTWMNSKKNKYGLNKAVMNSLTVPERFKKLLPVLKDNQVKNCSNPIGLLDVATKFCFMDLVWRSDSNVNGVPVSISIDGVEIASGKAQNIKKAKTYIHQLALDVLFDPHFCVVKDCGGNFVVSLKSKAEGPIPRPSQPVDRQVVAQANPLEKRFYQLSQIMRTERKRQPNVLQLIQVSAVKASLKVFFSIDELPSHNPDGKKTNPTFECKLFLEGVLTGEARGPSKKEARVNAYQVATNKLQEPYLKIITGEKGLKLVSTQMPLNVASAPVSRVKNAPVGKVDVAIQRQNEMNMVNSKQALEEMLLISDLGVRESANHISVVRQSADFNRIPCQFNDSYVKQGNVLCSRFQVMIGGQLFGEGVSENSKTAKLLAAKAAWENLQKMFYTVQIKELICEDGEQVSKSSLASGSQSTKGGGNGAEGKTLDEDNIGFKMLRMMGWGGGGVGKKGNEGIVQPVSVQDVYKREGLGFSREGRQGDFRKGINKVIKDFVESGTCSDLAFSPEFTKEERVYIHRIAERFNLRNSSHGGKGPNRHVVLSRRFRPQQLLEHLLQSGGSTKKYELIPPTND